jgi:hypothetical protein
LFAGHNRAGQKQLPDLNRDYLKTGFIAGKINVKQVKVSILIFNLFIHFRYG